jgi:hypothetical protein
MAGIRRPATGGPSASACPASGSSFKVAGCGVVFELAGTGFVTPPTLQVSPATPIAASGIQGQVSATFPYVVSASSGRVSFSISGLPTSPAWLTARFTTGTVSPNANPATLTDVFTVNDCGLALGSYSATIAFTNTNTAKATRR